MWSACSRDGLRCLQASGASEPRLKGRRRVAGHTTWTPCGRLPNRVERADLALQCTRRSLVSAPLSKPQGVQVEMAANAGGACAEEVHWSPLASALVALSLHVPYRCSRMPLDRPEQVALARTQLLTLVQTVGTNPCSFTGGSALSLHECMRTPNMCQLLVCRWEAHLRSYDLSLGAVLCASSRLGMRYWAAPQPVLP
jgi:hypothetical protein